MGIISWIIVGGLAGWLASIVMGSNQNQGLVMDIVLGIVGALVGGFILQALGLGGEVSGINIQSILTAFVGALIVLGIYRAVAGRRA